MDSVEFEKSLGDFAFILKHSDLNLLDNVDDVQVAYTVYNKYESDVLIGQYVLLLPKSILIINYNHQKLSVGIDKIDRSKIVSARRNLSGKPSFAGGCVYFKTNLLTITLDNGEPIGFAYPEYNTQSNITSYNTFVDALSK